jgi:uncharacterized membrane-anchored protein YitT (DUF2179 family)
MRKINAYEIGSACGSADIEAQAYCKSVDNSEAKRELITLIRSIDKHAFINVVKTEELDGRFNDIPHD